ncbi:HNH endonuclease signature motif containing protein [Agrococcus sp. ARC_14]|uniref:HNH endonuclease signature motif containing protein n=1 Tax=Agrococcus sp. ARC_14 TaxID=2919927 RepID=UPI001F055EB5|nr:HNH endonuclease signature motif containing protein [Agrococcus sp. ARC_14]MCH1882727.1 HNH endonuclease [Agrococcus sp. ARC_14]
MTTDGLDADDYIAAIRAGAVDPFGHTADELQESLEAFDRDLTERLMALSDAEVEEVVAGRMALPPLPGPVESEHLARQRAESAYVGHARALHVQRARIEAEERELLAARFARLREEPGVLDTNLREAASSLAVELHLSDRTIERRMTDAWHIVSELPLTHDAHKAGRITAGHVRTISDATRALRIDSGVGADDRARVEAELVAVAEVATPGQLRSRAKRIVDRMLTAPLQQRHEVARETRSVGLFDAGDGMADLCARVPAAFGAAVLDRLSQAARGKPKDDPRTFDQFRADAFIELLLTGQTPLDATGINALRATITVTIPATALLADEQPEPSSELRFPALLDGDILVDAATIRSLAADTVTWQRLFLDPVSGIPITVDTYTPSRAMRRWLRARDGRCRWPGCTNPVSRADLDHTEDWAKGGRTSLVNLAHLCRRHHTMKHATAWTVEQLEHGILEWTSPLGVIIRDEPEPQGPRFIDTTANDEPLWGPVVCTEPSLPNAPPVALPF